MLDARPLSDHPLPVRLARLLRFTRFGTALCVLAAFAALALSPLQAQQDKSPDAALERLLQAARASLPGACSQPQADRLIKILCVGRIRVGVRDYYPLFSTRSGETRQ